MRKVFSIHVLRFDTCVTNWRPTILPKMSTLPSYREWRRKAPAGFYSFLLIVHYNFKRISIDTSGGRLSGGRLSGGLMSVHHTTPGGMRTHGSMSLTMLREIVVEFCTGCNEKVASCIQQLCSV